MFRRCVLLVFLVFLVKNGELIRTASVKQNDTDSAEILWNLSNIALQSRQRGSNFNYNYQGSVPQYYSNKYKKYYRYPLNYPNSHDYNYNYNSVKDYNNKYYKPSYGGYNPYSPPSFQKTRENILDVLFTVARNDDLQCVPKIICEMTSGTMYGRQQGLNLPLNLDMGSLIGLLSAFQGANASPVLHFGKAALLGYASKGNAGSCSQAYPSCPSDPDRLVQYLNNHNGGFFRYFSGYNHQQHQYPSFLTQNQHYPYAQKRIQNKPDPSQTFAFDNDNDIRDYSEDNFRHQKGIAFPKEENEVPSFTGQSGLRFPLDDFESGVVNFNSPYRKPKELPWDLDYYQNSEIDLQRPLPNHKATPLIFPLRTGTGNLRLDPEELDNNRQVFQDDDVRVTFNNFDDLRQPSEDYRGGRGLFTFPTH